MSEQHTFESWCIVELFGHQRLAGYVTEQTIAGVGFIRVDVPEIGRGVRLPGFTRLFGPAAIYALNPCDEESARACAGAWRTQPLQLYEARAMLAAGNTADKPDRLIDQAGGLHEPDHDDIDGVDDGSDDDDPEFS